MALSLYNLTKALLIRHNGTVPAAGAFDSSVDKEVLAHKEFINSAIQDINSEQFEWPFNNTTGSVTCVTGTNTYAEPTDAKTIDWNSFVLQKDDSLSVETSVLEYIDYHEYVERLAERDGDATTTDFTKPDYVFRQPDGSIGISPRPDKAYTINFSYYQYPSELTAGTDVTNIPDMYRSVILAGASWYSEARRDNEMQASTWRTEFKKGVLRMRRILSNKTNRFRSGIITRSRPYTASNKFF